MYQHPSPFLFLPVFLKYAILAFLPSCLLLCVSFPVTTHIYVSESPQSFSSSRLVVIQQTDTNRNYWVLPCASNCAGCVTEGSQGVTRESTVDRHLTVTVVRIPKTILFCISKQRQHGKAKITSAPTVPSLSHSLHGAADAGDQRGHTHTGVRTVQRHFAS